MNAKQYNLIFQGERAKNNDQYIEWLDDSIEEYGSAKEFAIAILSREDASLRVYKSERKFLIQFIEHPQQLFRAKRVSEKKAALVMRDWYIAQEVQKFIDTGMNLTDAIGATINQLSEEGRPLSEDTIKRAIKNNKKLFSTLKPCK